MNTIMSPGITAFHKDGTLPENMQVFVFGSNLAGRHGKGAAKIAVEKFGAVMGIGRGVAGKTYAIPTKDEYLRPLSLSEIAENVHDFVIYARERFGKDKFFVTRVGCGLAGYSDEVMAPMFRHCPISCSFAKEWAPYLRD